MDLDAYFARIDFQGPRDASLATLRRLHESHLGAIPFENLDILLGKPIRLELDALEQKLVTDRRGGYCFEQNSLFRAVLEALGFTVTSLAARVRTGAKTIRPRTHMLLRVDLEDGPHLADVGFGGDGPRHPLKLEGGTIGGRHELVEEDGTWLLRSGGLDLYAFTLEPHYPIDFEMANHYTSTYPSSIFVQSLTAQRIQRESRTILRNRNLTIEPDDGEPTAGTINNPEHLLEILQEHFNLTFPKGTRFSKPEFEP